MTIASEITRLQWAKADARTSIINKWVDVPLNVSVEDYHTYIDQIDIRSWGLFEPLTYVIPDIRQTVGNLQIKADGWDIINANNSKYFHYFWLRKDSTTAFQDFHLAVLIKEKWADAIYIVSDAKWTDRFDFRTVEWRMKKVWNDIIYSALYYELTSSTSLAKDHYYSITATNSTFSGVQDCWIIDDIWQAAVYANWTNNCWITAEESLASINKTTLTLPSTWSDEWKLVATLNN